MKTTIEIADDLLERSRELARARDLTLRAVVEEGLALALQRAEHEQRFRVSPVTFRGSGMSPNWAAASWERIRDEVYRGHGA